MSNVDSGSTGDNPRSLRNIFLDLKSDLKTKTDTSSKVKKIFEECVGSSSEISANSTSNFDDELSTFLKNTNMGGNLMDLLNKKYLTGYAISEAFSGTDLEGYTLFHLWNTKRTSQNSYVLNNQLFNNQEDTLELTKRTEYTNKDQFIIFYQQLFYSWQSQLEFIDRTRPIFKIPPQDNSLVHGIEPKTTCLVLMTCLYGLGNVKFLGLRNDPNHSSVPGPYLSLMSMDSKGDFFTCLTKIKDFVFNRELIPSEDPSTDSSYYFNIDGYLNISYFVQELDFVYSYILFHDKCYSKYTEPILLKSFTSWSFGKTRLLLYCYRMRYRYRDFSLSQVLNRFDFILYLICKIFSEFKGSSRQAPLDKFMPKNFNFLCFTCIIYSYLYAILSIPLELLPWERLVLDKPMSSEVDISNNTDDSDHNFDEENEDTFTNSNLNSTNVNSNCSDSDDLPETFNMINLCVHNEFAETAADSTCVENTRRHDNLMTYVIGLVNGEGNWIKRKEKFVDVIDTYKLGLSWYRRPSFSNTLYNTSYKAWPIALYYYNLLIEPCGRAFFVWYWKNIEAWSCSKIWSYRTFVPQRAKTLSQFLKKVARKRPFHTDSNLQLKRQVSLRFRDTVSYLFDMELELKRALLYS